ncbi:metal-dependent hydrolase [Halieaceae bacterium IMCC14734]|uniref:Metal-dependent hydrolase n=1 Tax=Candidatus Litorirhabdus singularis TaxID=2518993 RepID=A0ABT3TG42_9GAMM|nr:metal-dependent hydrolase [Candidatus Litorirhabdus singularis]MCX2981263.1 metal-dependent hydrolase [Candidatus Litorirhabdus singularis]
MDPLTQAALGAAAPQAVAKPGHLVTAAILGCLAGMAPDLDVLIRSPTDPLLFLEYHRQFTHSLLFIPFGGLLCGLILHRLIGRRRGLTQKQSILFCTLGYATHALLDSCTTYGTLLLWPFSDARIAWNTVSVIDPLFTLPLLMLVLIAAVRKRPGLARIALLWALIYPSIGLLQRDRAVEAGWELATTRGHVPLRLEAKPSFGNLLVWKIVYETADNYYVDAARVAIELEIYPGQKLEKLVIARDLPWLDPDSQQAKDIERFRWFSNGYIAKSLTLENGVTDIRYSMLPNSASGLWSIVLSPTANLNQHVAYQAMRDANPDQLTVFRSMLLGTYTEPSRPATDQPALPQLIPGA